MDKWKWKCANGEKINLRDITEQHARNIIRKLSSNAGVSYNESLLTEYAYRLDLLHEIHERLVAEYYRAEDEAWGMDLYERGY